VVTPMIATRPLESAVWAALHDVHDPEIPTISVVDLGVVRTVEAEDGGIRVELLPTFVGCPAIEVMRSAIEERLSEFADNVRVEISYAVPWTSERITPEGRRVLRQSGFAPPELLLRRGPSARLRATQAGVPRDAGFRPSLAARPHAAGQQLSILPTLPVAECPYCGSRNTTLENAFGPTLCRAIYHCANCSQPFEQFKEV
jgi:ring-1,2-phenylacetyl-CoA epoxidase subunit PaaD